MSLPEVARPRASSRARVRFNAAMKTLRRLHMVAGLFLVPFVLLYGVTAFLFNHPDWLADRDVRPITSRDVSGTALEGFPSPEDLAARVVSALNRDRAPSSSPVRLASGPGAAYSRDLALTATTPGHDHLIFLELEARAGTVRSAPIAARPADPDWSRRAVHLDHPPAEAAREAVAAVLARWEGSPEMVQVKIRTPPDLIFTVEDADAATGRRWRVAYNLQTEALSIRPAGPSLSARRFLTGLHLASRYPSHWGVRWLWALIVDAMFAAMVFWGLSGLLMWWQMKSLRRLGMIVLAASIVLTLLLATGMHGELGR